MNCEACRREVDTSNWYWERDGKVWHGGTRCYPDPNPYRKAKSGGEFYLARWHWRRLWGGIKWGPRRRILMARLFGPKAPPGARGGLYVDRPCWWFNGDDAEPIYVSRDGDER